MEFIGTFWSLVPPIVAIVLALITKEAYSSLFVGIVVGALLLAGFNPVDTLNFVVGGSFEMAGADPVVLPPSAPGLPSTSRAAWAVCSRPSCWACSSSWTTTSTA